MASQIDDLQLLLEEILGNTNVYFQPPESFKMHYPCIVYELNKVTTGRANNRMYKVDKCYKVTLMHKDPENDVVDKLISLPLCRMVRPPYSSNNLNHYVFELYF